MKAREIISELAVAPGISKALKQKGYKHLGSGQDQLVFLEPKTGLILKIFGTNSSQGAQAGSNGLPFPQKTFVAFSKYCAANPGNEFLPNFSGWETFEYDGQRYLQIRCERLFPGTKYRRWFNYLEEIANAAPSNKAGAKHFLEDLLNDDWVDHDQLGGLITMLGGEEGFYQLWGTLYDLGKIASSNGFYLDLHDENFMLGSDGHIVISDPFFSGWGKRDV